MATVIDPETLAPARGYSNGLILSGTRRLFVAGQIGWDRDGKVVSDAFVDQFQKALENVMEVVRAAGGGPEHVGRLTIYVTDRVAYLQQAREIGVRYRAIMGKHFPAMALVQVAGLLELRAMVEIEADALLP